jgi:uncharacterized membrane protein YkoI
MRSITAVLFVLSLLVAPGAAQENLTGKWSGSFTIAAPDGTSREQGIELNLTHKGTDLTGTAGPDAGRQWTITNGVVAGTKATFQVQENASGPLISITLTLTNGRLIGDASGEDDDGRKLSATIDAGRVK